MNGLMMTRLMVKSVVPNDRYAKSELPKIGFSKCLLFMSMYLRFWLPCGSVCVHRMCLSSAIAVNYRIIRFQMATDVCRCIFHGFALQKCFDWYPFTHSVCYGWKGSAWQSTKQPSKCLHSKWNCIRWIRWKRWAGVSRMRCLHVLKPFTLHSLRWCGIILL